MERRTMHQKRRSMKKRSNLLGWLSLMLVLLAIIFGLSQFFIKESEAATETIMSSEIYPGLNLKTTTQEANTYTFFVSQPYTEKEGIDEQIDEWIEQERNNFTEEVQNAESMLKENDFNAHLNVQTSTTKLSNTLYNLELESYQITGGANGLTKTRPIILDLNTQEILKPTDILQLDTESVVKIRELVFEEVQNNPEVSDYIFDELLEEALENFEEWKLSIHPESVVFLFDQYQIAAGAAGVIKAEIPMDKIIFYLSPFFAERMDLETPEKQVELKPDGKYIALTFDDGPHTEVTPKVLEILNQHGAKATFYMLGKQVEYYPSLAKQVLDEGHEIGDHTMSHKDLTRLESTQIKEEIQQSSNKILEATGNLPKSLRPPYGAFNEAVEEISRELALPVIMWSVDSLDWKNRDITAINQEVMSTIHPGAIVLLHDIHATTADALPQLLISLKNEGYEFITVSQLIEFGELEGIGPHNGINK